MMYDFSRSKMLYIIPEFSRRQPNWRLVVPTLCHGNVYKLYWHIVWYILTYCMLYLLYDILIDIVWYILHIISYILHVTHYTLHTTYYILHTHTYIYIYIHIMISHKHMNSTSNPRSQKLRETRRVSWQEQVDEAAAQVMMALLCSVTPDSGWLRSGTWLMCVKQGHF